MSILNLPGVVLTDNFKKALLHLKLGLGTWDSRPKVSVNMVNGSRIFYLNAETLQLPLRIDVTKQLS